MSTRCTEALIIRSYHYIVAITKYNYHDVTRKFVKKVQRSWEYSEKILRH